DRAEHVVQNVVLQDPKCARTARPRRFDEIEVAGLRRDRLRNAHQRRYKGDRQSENRVSEPGAENSGDRDSQQDGWKGIKHVDDAHDRAVDETTRVTGENTK